MMTEEEKKIILDIKKGIENLTKELNRYTSLKAALLRGVVYGVGTAIGATVIAAVVIWLFLWIFKPIVNELPFINADTIDSLEANVLNSTS